MFGGEKPAGPVVYARRLGPQRRSVQDPNALVAAMRKTVRKEDPRLLADALIDAMPSVADRRQALVALGMVTTVMICESASPIDRAELVDAFCKILRDEVAKQLN